MGAEGAANTGPKVPFPRRAREIPRKAGVLEYFRIRFLYLRLVYNVLTVYFRLYNIRIYYMDNAT